jgi:hypothetical protein
MIWLLALACIGGDTPSLTGGDGGSSSGDVSNASSSTSSDGSSTRSLVSRDNIDCDDDSRASRPLSSDCITAEVKCGQAILGHTAGGSSVWDDTFYRSKFCAPADEGTYLGRERIYWLDSPTEVEVQVELKSPCEDLDLFLVTWSDPNVCPTANNSVSSCEADTSRGGGRVISQNINHGYTYLIGVESRDGKDAPFEIEVRCTPIKGR